MASHYLFELDFCNPAAGWEKGQVEKQVRDVRHALWQDAPTFASLDALNQWLLQRCRGLWQTNAHPTIPSTTIAQHPRIFLVQDNRTLAQTCYDWQHYLSVLQRKPGALRNGAPFTTLPDAFKRLQDQLLKRPGGDREMVDILALVLFYEVSKVEQAVEEALTTAAPSKQTVLNCLNRLNTPPLTQTDLLDVNDTLTLAVEPLADTTHYDTLREGYYAH